MPGGICAGQGWESESKIDLSAYHRAKTGALFTAATRMGAAAAGEEPDAWTELGARIGEAFQVADDLRDALYDEVALGKPAHQDEINGRPNAVAATGREGLRSAGLRISCPAPSPRSPPCPGEAALCDMVRKTAERLTPRGSRPADGLTLVDQRRHASPASEPLGPGLCLAHRAFAVARRSRRPPPARPSPHAWRARTGEALFDLVAGFVHSQVLRAFVDLDLAARLAHRPKRAEELALEAGLPPERMRVLCQAAASLNLMQRRRDGRFALGRLGAALPGIPGLAQMIAHH